MKHVTLPKKLCLFNEAEAVSTCPKALSTASSMLFLSFACLGTYGNKSETEELPSENTRILISN